MKTETLSRTSPIASEVLLTNGLLSTINIGWPKIISDLKNYFSGISGMDEEGLKPPTASTINFAIDIAESMDRQSFAPPSRIAPNGEGGILFELYERIGNDLHYETIEIFDTYESEICEYKNSKLINRYPGPKANLAP